MVQPASDIFSLLGRCIMVHLVASGDRLGQGDADFRFADQGFI